MANKDSFTVYHPMINFLFFIGAIVCGMFFIHPLFVVTSAACAAIYLLTVRGSKAVPLLTGMIGVFCVISMINPIFNTSGEHVLFRMFGRPYTLEALYYGMTLAGMMVSVLLWFSSYHAVMTSDKFLYLFGKLSPAFSLVLTMILRLIPNYQKKIRQISEVRKSIGKSEDDGTIKNKIENGMLILSVTTSWAFEGGIVMADSMQSRGYGSTQRTRFSIYRFEKKDKILLLGMLLILGGIIWCGISGAAAITFTPRLEMRGTPYFIATGLICYAVFLLIPTAINIKEKMVWHILRSRI